LEQLEIPKVLILIGQQASGKSTISKLIYFFKSLREDVLKCLEEHELSTNLQMNERNATQRKLIPKVKARFYTFFGSTKYDDFDLKYEYKRESWVNISPDGNGSIIVEFAQQWFNTEFYHLIGSWNQFLLQQNNLKNKNGNGFVARETSAESIIRRREDNEIRKLRVEIDKRINQLFGNDNNISHQQLYYVPAGRSLLSSLKQSHQSRLVDEFKNAGIIDEIVANSIIDDEKSTRERKSYFEFFVRDFFERIDKIKEDVLFGKTLDEVIEEFELLVDNTENVKAREFRMKLKNILKADYRVDANGERLHSEKFSKPIKLDFASSGQQESIWILLQLFVLILEKQPAFIVIEEPEAHLYPSAQNEMLKLIVLFQNTNEYNQVIITTHSPYILTSANNLLFAFRTSEKFKDHEVDQKISSTIGTSDWLNPINFGAYYLSSSEIRNIFNRETGVISESELDEASEDIMSVFDEIMEIYSA